MSSIRYRIRETLSNISLPPDIDPVLANIYLSRGIDKDQQLDLGIRHLYSPDSFRNIHQAAELLYQVLLAKEKILIVGDYDADGATSTALCKLCLDSMGFPQVDFLVPDRFEFGYGLSSEIVDIAAQSAPGLIITVDNGIASHQGVQHARELGIKVLVTDHHLAAATLPDADCIINPNQPGCNFPSKSIAGVGVAFYLMSALRAYLRQQDWFTQQGIREPRLAEFLDLVALGTVADVVPLDANNRRLVNYGIELIRQGRCRPGISELLMIAGKNPRSLQASDLGFAVGPRLNAAGRLQDMAEGIKCLLADSSEKARQLALDLDALNRDRKTIELEMKHQAMDSINAINVEQFEQEKGICLYHPEWHSGVVGIIASRLKDKFHRPSIVFADSLESADTEAAIKGSCRSIPGLHIRDLLDAITKQHPQLISKFGGHAMAAGLTIARDDFETFKNCFNELLDQWLKPEQLQHVYQVDCQLPASYLNLEFARTLRQAGPWGQEFPEPLFHGEFVVRQRRVLADRHIKFQLSPVEDNAILIDAIVFNVDEPLLRQDVERIELVYRLDINEYKGYIQPQLLIEEFAAI